MRIPSHPCLTWLPCAAALVLLACGRSDGGRSGGKPEAEDGRPYGGVGHGTGEPGTGYGGQTGDKAVRNPAPDSAGGADRATRPGVGNANAR